MRPARDDGGPAFPGTLISGSAGMTKREWFTGQALAGLFGSRESMAGCLESARETGRELEETVAILAVKIADSVLKELGRDE